MRIRILCLFVVSALLFISFLIYTPEMSVSRKGDRDGGMPQSWASSEKERESYDQPDEAAEFFRRRRIPPGESEIPIERYLTAIDHIKRMPQYSTAANISISASNRTKDV